MGPAADKSLGISTVVTPPPNMNQGIYYAIALLTFWRFLRLPRPRCYLTLGSAETRTIPDCYASLYSPVVRFEANFPFQSLTSRGKTVSLQARLLLRVFLVKVRVISQVHELA
jgi:hypothetical protein